jgi:hypothetical protein
MENEEVILAKSFAGVIRVGLCVLLLVCLACPLVFADLAIAPSTLGGYRPFNARVWGMGGACTALGQEADGLIANPAAVAFNEGQQVLVGMARMNVDATLMYDSVVYPLFDDSFNEWSIAYSQCETEEGGAVLGAGIVYSNSEEFLGYNDLSLAIGGRSSADSPFGWGLSMDTPGGSAYFGLGALYRNPDGLSLGLNWDDIFSDASDSADIMTVGAAYQAAGFTAAVDVFGIAGDLIEEREILAGLEYRDKSGVALRVGSAAGNLTYGIGFAKSGWSVDYARLTQDESVTILGGTITEEDDLSVISVSYTFQQ